MSKWLSTVLDFIVIPVLCCFIGGCYCLVVDCQQPLVSAALVAAYIVGTCILFCRGLIKCLDLQGPNVCPRYVITSEVSTTDIQWKIECCPNYYEYEDACKECQAGTYGDNCSDTCLPNYYGAVCNNLCNCNKFSKCDHVKGCICNDGFTGTDCKDYITCPIGWYGRNCSYTCACSYNGICDAKTGDCVCPPGLHGPNCSHTCLVGRFGRNCSEMCTCPHDVTCDPQTGQCRGQIHSRDPNYTQKRLNMATIGLSVLGVVMLSSTIMLSIILYRRRTQQVTPPNTEDRNIVHYHEIPPYGELSLEGLTQEEHTPHQINQNVHSRLALRTNNPPIETSGLRNVVNEDGGYLNPYCVIQPYSNTDRVYKRLFLPLTRSLSTGNMTPSSTETNTTALT